MPQKKSLKKVEKKQRKRVKEKKDRVEKIVGSLEISDIDSDELKSQLEKMKAITPTSLAVQFNIKVSMAKKLLETLRRDEIVDVVSRSHNLKVYTFKGD